MIFVVLIAQLVSAITSTAHRIKGNLTAYSPQGNGDTMQGDYRSSQPGPDGKFLVRTLDDVASGRSSYVTLAGDPKLYGRTYIIPRIAYIDKRGHTTTLEHVKAIVHDTGEAFDGAPEGRFDVPVARDIGEALRNANHAAWRRAGVEFMRP